MIYKGSCRPGSAHAGNTGFTNALSGSYGNTQVSLFGARHPESRTQPLHALAIFLLLGFHLVIIQTDDATLVPRPDMAKAPDLPPPKGRLNKSLAVLPYGDAVPEVSTLNSFTVITAPSRGGLPPSTRTNEMVSLSRLAGAICASASVAG